MKASLFVFLLAAGVAGCTPTSSKPLDGLPALSQESASNFAQLSLTCVQKQFPNYPGYILNAAEDVEARVKVHPAVYGFYDCQSSVHGHWMRVRLLRLFPKLPEAAQIRKALNENLTWENAQK